MTRVLSANRSATGLVLAVLILAVMLTVPAYAAQNPADPARMEAKLQFDKVLPVLVNAGAGDDKETLRLVWAVFSREKETVEARLRCTMLSYPKGKWRVEMRLADRAGKVLQSREAVLENSGICISFPFIEEFGLRLSFDRGATRAAARFAISVRQAEKEAPVNAAIEQAEPKYPPAEKGDRWIDVKVQDSNGAPIAHGMEVWAKLDGKPESQPQMVNRSQPTYWEQDGAYWRICRSIGGSVREEYVPTDDSYRIEELPPGVYRVAAYTAIRPSNRDTTPVGVTDDIDLRTAEGTARTIVLGNGWPLTIRIVDGLTAKPAGRTMITMRGPDGMPVVERATEEDGVLTLRSLKPGRYTVEVGERGWWSYLHPEAITTTRVTVKPNADNTAVIKHTEAGPIRAGL